MSEQLSGLLEEEVVGGDVTKVRGVMYYQFECQNFQTLTAYTDRERLL